MYEERNELCWTTGNHSDECICELCPHNDECGGYNNPDDNYEELNELCWTTGNYSNECICELCPHNDECSGYNESDDE